MDHRWQFVFAVPFITLFTLWQHIAETTPKKKKDTWQSHDNDIFCCRPKTAVSVRFIRLLKMKTSFLPQLNCPTFGGFTLAFFFNFINLTWKSNMPSVHRFQLCVFFSGSSSLQMSYRHIISFSTVWQHPAGAPGQSARAHLVSSWQTLLFVSNTVLLASRFSIVGLGLVFLNWLLPPSKITPNTPHAPIGWRTHSNDKRLL